MYYLLSGQLPFDDPSDNDEVVAKITVFNEVEFPKQIFDKRSPAVIDLITKCLIKDPEKRITIDNILNHEWFNLLGYSEGGKKSKKKLEIKI